MGKASPSSVVLDAGALIAFERGDERMRALIREALKRDARLLVPAGVLAQVFRDRRRQVALRALVAGRSTEVPALDRLLAEAAGVLCGLAGTSDVIDATVAIVAKKERAKVVTSDAGDLRRLDRGLELVPIRG